MLSRRKPTARGSPRGSEWKRGRSTTCFLGQHTSPCAAGWWWGQSRPRSHPGARPVEECKPSQAASTPVSHPRCKRQTSALGRTYLWRMRQIRNHEAVLPNIAHIVTHREIRLLMARGDRSGGAAAPGPVWPPWRLKQLVSPSVFYLRLHGLFKSMTEVHCLSPDSGCRPYGLHIHFTSSLNFCTQVSPH